MIATSMDPLRFKSAPRVATCRTGSVTMDWQHLSCIARDHDSWNLDRFGQTCGTGEVCLGGCLCQWMDRLPEVSLLSNERDEATGGLSRNARYGLMPDGP